MSFIKTLFCLAALLTPGSIVQASGQKETVLILHGIARSSASMKSVERALQEEGYDTRNITYPSTEKDLDGLAIHLREKHLTEKFWQSSQKLHVVTHSMGGLVARRYLDTFKEQIPEEKLGRVVMLAPPNGGSEVADAVRDLLPYRWYYGPAGDELTTEYQSGHKSDVYYDLGIVAGTKEWPYMVAAFVVPGRSDGRVSVENTKLEGMKDHVSVNETHTFIMDSPEVHRQIINFLREGNFQPENGAVNE